MSTANLSRRVVRIGSFCAAGLIALGASAQVTAPVPIPPERLNWHGDSRAPDISGVWIRDDAASRTAASKEGWSSWPPALTPSFAKTWRARVADAAAGKRTDDPMRACLPPGMPRFMTGMTGPLLIMQTPGRVTLYRDGSAVRRVWLDGRAPPAPKDLESFYNGTAAGRYEGQELVTDVRGMKDLPIDATGLPHSDGLRIVERFRRVDATTLRVELTLTDPVAYIRPIRSVVVYRAGDPGWEPKEFICAPEKDFHPEMYVR